MYQMPHRITRTLTHDDTVLWLRFTTEHPQNVMTRALLADLSEVIRELEDKPGRIRVLVIQGSPRVFCAGMDRNELKVMTRDQHWQLLVDEHKFWRAIESLPIVSVASLNGPVVGFGAHFALCCDARVASEDVRIGLPEIRLAVAATAQRVARFVGIGRAKEILMTGRLLPASEALAWGLLTEVTQREFLEERTESVVARYAALSRSALAMAKASIENAFKWETSQHGREIETVLGSIEADDFKEAMRAAAEKRPPKFS